MQMMSLTLIATNILKQTLKQMVCERLEMQEVAIRSQHGLSTNKFCQVIQHAIKIEC